jgi:hypothetical protein
MKVISVDSFYFNLSNSYADDTKVCLSSNFEFNGGDLIVEVVSRNKISKYYHMKFLRKSSGDNNHTIWRTTYKRVKELTLRDVRELRLNTLLG